MIDLEARRMIRDMQGSLARLKKLEQLSFQPPLETDQCYGTGFNVRLNQKATDHKVIVSADDTTPDFLENKLTAGANITLTETTEGGNETMTIAASGGGTTTNITQMLGGGEDEQPEGFYVPTVVTFTAAIGKATGPAFTLANGTSGGGPGWSAAGFTLTLNVPDAQPGTSLNNNRGLVNSLIQAFSGNKLFGAMDQYAGDFSTGRNPAVNEAAYGHGAIYATDGNAATPSVWYLGIDGVVNTFQAWGGIVGFNILPLADSLPFSPGTALGLWNATAGFRVVDPTTTHGAGEAKKQLLTLLSFFRDMALSFIRVTKVDTVTASFVLPAVGSTVSVTTNLVTVLNGDKIIIVESALGTSDSHYVLGHATSGGQTFTFMTDSIHKGTAGDTISGTLTTPLRTELAVYVENRGVSGTDQIGNVHYGGIVTTLGANTLTSGTYTPTLTNNANLTASTAYACQYMRVKNVVTVSGKVDVTPTLAATDTKLFISLPIASTLSAEENCGGTAQSKNIAGQGAAILADIVGNQALMEWKATDITNQPMYFSFTYLIT